VRPATPAAGTAAFRQKFLRIAKAIEVEREL
jgi:hypothetical protein